MTDLLLLRSPYGAERSAVPGEQSCLRLAPALGGSILRFAAGNARRERQRPPDFP